jgi:acetyl-CoA C-acetyltransferase
MNGYSREDVDAFALRSQKKAVAAQDAGAFERSIVPVIDEVGLPYLTVDEHPRRDSTMEALGKLKASFTMMGEQFALDSLATMRYPEIERIRHIHTAGNSSGIVDGAAAVLIASREKGEAMGLKPRAKIRSVGLAGTEPILMLTGPMPASRKALQKAGMEVGDIDLFEVNEAFAAVPMVFMNEMGVSEDRVNVNGGAIALGHPLGATGAMLIGTLMDALEDQDKTTGLVTLCVGGGMGIATIIERV